MIGIQDIEEDMKVNGWGPVEKISEINDSIRMLNLFQDFYVSTGRLPAFYGLLVVPDGDTSENSNKVNMRNLYDLFKNTKSHGLFFAPFLGHLLHFFESEKDVYLIKNATTEVYKNVSYMNLSGRRNLEFEAVSDFIPRFSVVIKENTIQNINNTEDVNISLAEQINAGRIFDPVVNDSLDGVIEIMDVPEPEHKKKIFLYVEPTVYPPYEIEEYEKRTNDDYTDLITKINRVSDVATEQKKQKKIEDFIKSVIDYPLPNNDFWWEEYIFDQNNKQPTIDSSRMFYDDIKKETSNILKDIDIDALSNNILGNLRPVDNRNLQELIDHDFIPTDDRTQQEREDDERISLINDDVPDYVDSDNDAVTIEDVLEPPSDTTNTSKNPFITTIEDVLQPPTINQAPPLPTTKTLDVDINTLSENILKNSRPIDNRNLQF